MLFRIVFSSDATRQPGPKSGPMSSFAAGPSGYPGKPFGLALKKRGTDFQCRISCTENLCRPGGLGSHYGFGVGLGGPPAIMAWIIVRIIALKGLRY